MKRILYTILLAIGTLSFSSCTDYINVDKYFYDQVSLPALCHHHPLIIHC